MPKSEIFNFLQSEVLHNKETLFLHISYTQHPELDLIFQPLTV
jgi:hypothetical protein